MKTSLYNTFKDLMDTVFSGITLTANQYSTIKGFVILILTLIVGVVFYFFAKFILVKIIVRATKKTKTNWDDILLDKKTLNHVAILVPALIVYMFLPYIFNEFAIINTILFKIIKLYFVIVIVQTISSILKSFLKIYNARDIAKARPAKGYVQLISIIVYFIAGIIIIGIVANKSTGVLIGGLGAMAAVLLLIFKDTILGLVSSIQLSSNDMLRIGDWITFERYNADGDVLDINLTSVKVQNFDKTITTIPTYSMVTEAFQNWRGMEDSAGRRIKRSLYFDVNSVGFCDEKMLDKFEKMPIISSYVKEKRAEMKQYNKEFKLDGNYAPNARRITNIGTFRKYVEEYLRNNDHINTDMTFLIRQMEAKTEGLPLEIYVFSNIQAWVQYEALVSDIFDHLLSIVHEFDLSLFQTPSGRDFRELKK